MSTPAPHEIALYVGIVLVLIWVAYRLYVSFYIKPEGFASAGTTFTMYYADWCGHCKTAKPDFQKLGSTQTIAGKTVSIRMVNPETQPDQAAGVDIKGYPTIVLMNGGSKVEYQGERTHSGFLSFLQQNVR